MVRVLVVEDEASLRADLVDYLSAKGFIVEEAATVAESRARIGSQEFDAMILDVGLPDGDGFELLADVRGRGMGCGVMMLTSFGDPDFRVRGLDEGADAYLVKKATLREIEATLRSILRRQSGGTPVQRFLGWTLDRVDWQLTAPNGIAVKLTGNEMAFATALAEISGRVCSRERLAQVTGRSDPVDDRNLDMLLQRLRRKVESVTGLQVPIKVVYGAGYTCTGAIRLVG